MAEIITAENAAEQTGMRGYWTYNALDCCVTREVWDVLRPRLTETTERIYKFELGSQAPAMAMMLRGVPVDDKARRGGIETLEEDYADAVRRLNLLVSEVWDGTELETGICTSGKRHRWPKGEPDDTRRCSVCSVPRTKPGVFNPNSDDQGSHLLYTLLKIPPQYNKKGKVSVDKECLERVGRKYPKVAPIVGGIKEARGIWKQVSVLSSGVSIDGRIRSSFSVGGAWTGRWSSSSSPYNEGTNLQNIADKLRHIFVADPGKEIFYADLEQAESCAVAHLAGDEAYISAHASGDVHTVVSRLLWPDLPWTGDAARDKKVADGTVPSWDADHSYRYNAKRIQHGSNYMLSAAGIARIAHIPQRAAAEAQERYFDAFPDIKRWHYATIGELKRYGVLTSPSGRRCQFFGRIWDEHTWKQGVAFKPQSLVADILNCALWQVWRELDPELVWLYAQVHDAILGAYVKGDTTARSRLLELMAVPTYIVGLDGKERCMVIPVECQQGANWGKKTEKNPHGLAK